jgi:SNF2 family DNA or RNA helicase
MEPRPRVFDMSDPGTGKTRAHLEAFVNRLNHKNGGKALVFAPKSIMQPAWGNDIDHFYPGLRYSIAYSTNRVAAMNADADIYITNHDAAKDLVKKFPKSFWKGFDTLILDESDAFKHRTSARSKAAYKLAKMFGEYRENLSGTPNANGVMDLWHQAYILDDGARLGTRFWDFRSAVQTPTQVGPLPNHVKWSDKPGAIEAVLDMLRDISIRHKLQGVPENRKYDVVFDLPPKLRRVYDEVMRDAVSLSDNGELITAFHASSLNQKLLQIASGAVYTDGEHYTVLDDSRTELVTDLIEAREASVVVFNWRHQRVRLVEACEKRGLPIMYIDGTTKSADRTTAVKAFQNGDLRALIVHPRAAGHGLTLTRGQSTIYMSPTYDAALYKQVYHRIVRRTQTKKTETIHVVAKNTYDKIVYEDRLNPKLDDMELFLLMVQAYKESK